MTELQVGGENLVSEMVIRTDTQAPQITMTIKRDTANNQTLYFKGISEQKFAVAEVYIVVCSSESFTASRSSYLWLDQVQETGDGAFHWNTTSAVSYLFSSESMPDAPPIYFSDTKGCTITQIKAYTDEGLSQEFQPNANIKAIAVATHDLLPPTVTVTYQRLAAFSQTVFFKGFNANAFAKAAVTFRVCDLPVSKPVHTIFSSIKAAETELVEWKYTVAAAAANDKEYSSLPEVSKLPTFESLIEGCELSSLSFFTDEELTQPLPPSHPVQVIPVAPSPQNKYPTLKLEISRNSMYLSEIYAKGQI